MIEVAISLYPADSADTPSDALGMCDTIASQTDFDYISLSDFEVGSPILEKYANRAHGRKLILACSSRDNCDLDINEQDIADIRNLHPDVLVLPDCPDQAETLKAAAEFLGNYHSGIYNLPKSFSFMGVLHGVNLEEFQACLTSYATHPDITHIGLSSISGWGRYDVYRPQLIEDLHLEDFCATHNMQVHLLGVSDPFELQHLLHYPCVKSLNTSNIDLLRSPANMRQLNHICP